ncbi:arylesterase [Erythrobacter sp. MTPC3]|uniref:arylesterase n=1 Tax=Erythrobacter sp. MTPC3 TaxID=3056564 RepID=UPI0036F402F4
MQERTWSKTKIFAAALAAMAMPVALAGCSENADSAAPVPSDRAAARDDAGLPAIPVMGPQVNILAFGNSLFAGYGVDKADSYPAKLEAALRAKGINAAMVNAGVSGDTTSAGLQRLEFTLDAQEEKPDFFILELGGNDLLRGLSPAETKANLAAMLDELSARDIPVLLMGMRAPPNYGPEYQANFDALYGELAAQYDAELIPFWLEEIYQDPSLFQSDRIHPTEEGIEQLVAATVDDVAQALPATEAETAPA